MLLHEKRFFAALIDVSIIGVFSLIINAFLPNIIFSRDLLFLLVYFGIAFIYMIVSFLITKNKTIGLYIMSLRVLGKDWDKVTFKSIFLRSITYAIPALYIVNILYMAIYRTDETFFDEVSDSIVVKEGDTYKVEKGSNE